MDASIRLRTAKDEDRPFLLALYTELRLEELAVTNWSEEEKSAFCVSQFEAQDQHYRKFYRTCEFLIVCRGDQPIGRLYLDRRSDEIRVVDILLQATERSRGTGEGLMRQVLDEAASKGRVVRIHLERTNPARRLYDRLGFRMVAEGEVYDLLEWKGFV